MPRCNQGYEFCEDCSNQEMSDICDDCDDGDLFDPLFEDSSEGASTYPVYRLLEAA